MNAIAAGVIADDFGENRCPAFDGMFVIFQNDDASAFAADQAIAGGIEWAGRLGWGIVKFAGGCVKDVERSDCGFMQFLGPAAENNILPAEADLIVSRADGLKTRCAGG